MAHYNEPLLNSYCITQLKTLVQMSFCPRPRLSPSPPSQFGALHALRNPAHPRGSPQINRSSPYSQIPRRTLTRPFTRRRAPLGKFRVR